MKNPIVVVSHDDKSGVRTYELFNPGIEVINFCTLFNGKVTAYEYKVIDGQEVHKYTVTI